jgi:regulator of cell morphogenesis and NO signaling
MSNTTGDPTAATPLRTTSFLSLLATHEHLTELFLLHHEALLALDVELARARLRQFEIPLRAHMRVEEELLLPVYERAGRIQGGSVELYIGEHRKMLQFLERFAEKLDELLEGPKERPANLKREIIGLFDDEAVFKQLMQHHDMREQNILYPTLDNVSGEEERRDLLSRCRDVAAAE